MKRPERELILLSSVGEGDCSYSTEFRPSNMNLYDYFFLTPYYAIIQGKDLKYIQE